MAKRIIPGKNFLHTHPFREAKLKTGRTHVIVDREDWEKAISLLSSPKNLKKLNGIILTPKIKE